VTLAPESVAQSRLYYPCHKQLRAETTTVPALPFAQFPIIVAVAPLLSSRNDGAVYPGVDLVYYGNQKQLEYDFVLQPGVDPAKVRLSFTGNRSMHLEANGDLSLSAKAGEMRWKRPDVYQIIDGKRRIVAAHYSIRSERKGASDVGFVVAKYDHSRPLVIDPALQILY
jgi:hypothetical protein